MNNYVFSSIIGAAVIEFVSDFLPISQKSPLRKYIRYIISLIIALTIVSPIASLISEPDVNVFSKLSGFEYDSQVLLSEEPYLLVAESAVYAIDKSGNKKSDTPVLCDMYIAECARGIAYKAKDILKEKFSLDKNKINIEIAINVTDIENIELMCVNIKIQGASKYIISDVCDYLSDILDCNVSVI
ncbi:MAG: hypothetical protein E7635_02725 [Ruminococcaceae bacterium]|nr:hypothetical protein [Oscillospiraceae bacterium]